MNRRKRMDAKNCTEIRKGKGEEVNAWEGGEL
jgi:hypothetical protein